MQNRLLRLTGFAVLILLISISTGYTQERRKLNFGKDWKFSLSPSGSPYSTDYDDSHWRRLDLPHDWSIELPFDSTSPGGVGGGALRGGDGWYRKSFTLPWPADTDCRWFIHFDGVYRNSEVWVNGKLVGKRPNGYLSFSYDITDFLNLNSTNLIAVRADNSKQPNSRWYSGSGIYRDVWLEKTNELRVDQWGHHITTPLVSKEKAMVRCVVQIRNHFGKNRMANITTIIRNPEGQTIATKTSPQYITSDHNEIIHELIVNHPKLWSDKSPVLYEAETIIGTGNSETDRYTTRFGIRTFHFDPEQGFFLNGQPKKILGVCNHHDLGALGAAFNISAARRQLEILKEMGCNGIRTAHNPPAPQLLDLCDSMGFIVMDEAFDVWTLKKNEFDYHLDWEEWHVRDLEDLIRRDRNHPSVFIWSIGNEVNEQWDAKNPLGGEICRELTAIVKRFDPTRPVVAALSNPKPSNPLVKAGVLDLIGFNYEHRLFRSFRDSFPGAAFIGSETVSALATRGHYDRIPSDSIRRWPRKWDEVFTGGNADNTVSAYDHVSTPWGSTHEETWKLIKKYPWLSGGYIWTGFDYIGEPTPYIWPSRSSYFGILDLAGFPKDTYYMYQSEWTDKNVLHILPHWNWGPGDTVDVWAYYNNAEEVELFLNGKSLGARRKTADDLHVMWRVPYEPGSLKAVSRMQGKTVMTKEVRTAGEAAKIELSVYRPTVRAGGEELVFITARITDSEGNTVPRANHLIRFSVDNGASVIATDNGSQTSHEMFTSPNRRAFNGLCLAIIRPGKNSGEFVVRAGSDGLAAGQLTIQAY